jgi:hypothetical protein
MYEEGRGVAPDAQETLRWYRLAAEHGSAPAQNNLGLLYYRGAGVERSPEEAAQWYERAAKQGFAAAQSNLGLLCSSVRPCHRTRSAGSSCSSSPPRRTTAKAERVLGSVYLQGELVARDEVRAARWYRRAAERNVPEAQFTLGWMLARGQGVAKDPDEAATWFARAAEQGLAVAEAQPRFCCIFEGEAARCTRDDGTALRTGCCSPPIQVLRRPRRTMLGQMHEPRPAVVARRTRAAAYMWYEARRAERRDRRGGAPRAPGADARARSSFARAAQLEEDWRRPRWKKARTRSARPHALTDALRPRAAATDRAGDNR